jgi:hypothetical protein
MTRICKAALTSLSLISVEVAPFLLVAVSFFFSLYDNKLLSYPSLGSTLPFFSKFIFPKRIRGKNFCSGMGVRRSEAKFPYNWR